MSDVLHETLAISGLLETLSAASLRRIVNENGISCLDKRSREGLITALQPIFRYRTDLLDVIDKDGLQEICDVFEINRSGSLKVLAKRVNDFTRTPEAKARFNEIMDLEDTALATDFGVENTTSADVAVTLSVQHDELPLVQNPPSLDVPADQKGHIEEEIVKPSVPLLNRSERRADLQYAVKNVHFAVQSTPCFDLNGHPILYASLDREWKTYFDAESKIFQYWNAYQGKSVFLERSIENILCIQATENEVNDVKHTVGRLALTAVGTDLFWKGRRGGVGAALLDLSARGMDKKSVISGQIVFDDFTVISFKSSSQEFEKFASLVGENCFDDDAIDEMDRFAAEFKSRLDDGTRVVFEMASEMVDSFEACNRLAEDAEKIQNFRQRAGARQIVKEKFAELLMEGAIMRALLHCNKISFADVLDTVRKSDRETFQILARTVIYEGSVIDYQSQAAVAPPSKASSRAVTLNEGAQDTAAQGNKTIRKGFLKRFFG